MDLHHRYLVAGVVGIFVERDQSWLAGLDELDEFPDAPALSLELPWFESVGRDEDERRRHGVFLSVDCPVHALACDSFSPGVVYGAVRYSLRNAFTSAANSLWCWKRKPWAES